MNSIRYYKQRNTELKTEYSGKFIIRTSPEIHRWLVEYAQTMGVSMNLVINAFLENKMKEVSGK